MAPYLPRTTAFRRLCVCLLALLVAASAAAEAFWLPSGEEVHSTGDPQVAVDARGGIHLVYPLVAAGGAVYGYCPADCAGPDQVRTVTFPTGELGTVHTALLALDAGGVPHVLFTTGRAVHYAACGGGDCASSSSWRVATVYEHDGDWEVTGDAFAIDPRGGPTFLMHAYQAFMGLFGPPPGTRIFACATDCLNAAAWRSSQVSEQSWLEASLRFDASGVMHVAAVVPVGSDELVGYFRCDGGCLEGDTDNWPGVGVAYAFSDRYVEAVYPAVSLALTAGGGVRLAFLGLDGHNRYLGYYECDAACTAGGEGWTLMALIYGDAGMQLGDGLELALDAQGRPSLAYTAQGNIFVAHCSTDCAGARGDDDWDLAVGELSGEIPTDTVFLEHNCTVGAWFLRQPALAIGADGLPVLAYRAEDISGGVTRPDITRPGCVAGVEMSLTRFNRLASY